MIIDGKALAEKIKLALAQKIAGLDRPLSLAVILVGEDIASLKYIAKKKRFAEAIGIEFKLFQFETDISFAELSGQINRLANDQSVSGIIVQLPLPAHLSTDQILALVPAEKDIDALSESPKVLSPVVMAVKEILMAGKVSLSDKKIVVVGRGKLVGRPIALWCVNQGGDVEIVDQSSVDISKLTKQADIIITGAGSPHLIKPEMIKNGAVLIDAGTSEAESKLLGDIDPACAPLASVFTPVPGGVGPLTVAMLFKNLWLLADANHLE